jgi:hypothetical protein
MESHLADKNALMGIIAIETVHDIILSGKSVFYSNLIHMHVKKSSRCHCHR